MIQFENLLAALRLPTNKKIFEEVKPWLEKNRVFYADDWGEGGRDLVEKIAGGGVEESFGVPFDIMSFEGDKPLSNLEYDHDEDTTLCCVCLLTIIKEPGPFDIPEPPQLPQGKKWRKEEGVRAAPLEFVAFCVYRDGSNAHHKKHGLGYGFVAHVTEGQVSMPQFVNEENPDEDDDELLQDTWQLVNQAFFNCSVALRNRNFTQVSESVRKKIKTGSGKNKTHVKINDVIRLLPKKEVGKAVPKFGRTIDYSHRWEVAGHWRKLPKGGIGLDQAGKRRVKGYTWIKSFEKGDKSKPLVKKIRVLQEN